MKGLSFFLKSKGEIDMIQLYVVPGCLSCRKARTWLEENKIAYEEYSIFSDPPNVISLKMMLQLTEEGTTELISTRSHAFQELNIDLDDLLISDFFELIQTNPALLRRPIIMDTKRLVVGYNEDNIRAFLPREVRKMELQRMQKVINSDDKLA